MVLEKSVEFQITSINFHGDKLLNGDERHNEKNGGKINRLD
jgi:hypothetical protein